jgi:hypothetical protein
VASASLILVVALPSRRHLSNTRWKVSRKRAPSSQTSCCGYRRLGGCHYGAGYFGAAAA